MKILHVITGLDVGGAETALYRLVTRMDRSEFDNRVVSLIAPGAMGAKLTDAGIPVDSLGMQRGVPTPGGLWRLVKHIRHWRPDIVQTWLYHADLAGLVAARLAFPLSTRPKVAWNIRCSFMALDEYRRMTGVTLKACAALSSLPDLVLTNSYEAKRFHQKLGYAPKRFEVMPNGFDTEALHPDAAARQSVREELSIPQDGLIVGHVARFDAMKDHRSFVAAAAEVAAGNPDAMFMLVGRGVDYDNLDLAAWMREYELAPERVRLLGERNDVPRLMAAMDIHVSSSIGESFPNVVGEAMACGVPAVVTDVGDSRSLVGDTGLIVQPDDPAGLAAGMNDMLHNSPERRGKMGAAARNRIEKTYSLSSAISNYSSLYRSLH